MKLTFLFCLLLGFPLAGCRDNDPDPAKTLDFKTFRLTVPANWTSVPAVGYDSQVRRITNGQDELSFDYGWYSYDLRNETPATHIRTTTTVGGYPALLVRPLTKGQGTMGVFIQTGAMNRFVLWGRNIQDERTVLKILESVTF